MKWRNPTLRAGTHSVPPVDFHESGRCGDQAAAISFRIRSAGPALRGRATRRFSASIRPGCAGGRTEDTEGGRTPDLLFGYSSARKMAELANSNEEEGQLRKRNRIRRLSNEEYVGNTVDVHPNHARGGMVRPRDGAVLRTPSGAHF